MEISVDTLKRTTPSWNLMQKEKYDSKKTLWGGLLFLAFGAFQLYFLFTKNTGDSPMKYMFLILPLIGFGMLGYSIYKGMSAAKMKESLMMEDPGSLEAIEKIYNSVKSCNFKMDSDVFEFRHHEGHGRQRRTFHWNVKLQGDRFIIVNRTRPEIHFLKKHELLIIGGTKGFLSNAFNTSLTLNGHQFNIYIYPDSFQKYEKLRSSMAGDSSSTDPYSTPLDRPPVKSAPQPPDDGDEIVKFNM